MLYSERIQENEEGLEKKKNRKKKERWKKKPSSSNWDKYEKMIIACLSVERATFIVLVK